MNNKIEKGCLAIVVKSTVSSNLGKVVRVGEFIGKVDGLRGDDRWEVDTSQTTNCDNTIYNQRESYLMRLDSYDQDMYNDEQIEQLEKEKVE